MGNQLFQYAMGRTLAIENQTVLKLDLSYFTDYEWHVYSLAPFNIKENFSTEAECLVLRKKHALMINRILRKTVGKGHFVVYERSLRYDVGYKSIKAPAYLVGYWQCASYFEKHRDVLLQEFNIKIQPSAANAKMLNQIQSTQSVSLHIRRGNFVNVEQVNKIHGTCSLEYYRQAIDYFNRYLSKPVYYVFSDDLTWAKESLVGKESFVFVDLNDASHDYEDLRLMSSSRHHIIANSTFSWWAAYLNPSTDKKVIAPMRWFADPVRNVESIDIVPPNWIRM